MSDQAAFVDPVGSAGVHRGERAVPDLVDPPCLAISVETPARRSSRRAAVPWAAAVAVVLTVVAAVVGTAMARTGTETISAGAAGPSVAVGAPGGPGVAGAVDRLTPEHRALVRRERPVDGSPPADRIPAGSLSELQVGPILDRLDGTAPANTIGGAWLTGLDGPEQQLVVESTADGAGRSALQEAADRILPGRIAIVSGRYDRIALERFKERAYGVVSADDLRSGVGFSVRDLELSTGSSSVVLVTLEPADLTDDLLSRLLAQVPADLLQVSVPSAGP